MVSVAVILSWLAATFLQYKHDNAATRQQLLQDAEKQCFEVQVEQRDCTALNNVINQNLIKGMPLPVDLTRNLKKQPDEVKPDDKEE